MWHVHIRANSVQIGRARLKSVKLVSLTNRDPFWISLGMAKLPRKKNWSFRGRSEFKNVHSGAEGNPPTVRWLSTRLVYHPECMLNNLKSLFLLMYHIYIAQSKKLHNNIIGLNLKKKSTSNCKWSLQCKWLWSRHWTCWYYGCEVVVTRSSRYSGLSLLVYII